VKHVGNNRSTGIEKRKDNNEKESQQRTTPKREWGVKGGGAPEKARDDLQGKKEFGYVTGEQMKRKGLKGVKELWNAWGSQSQDPKIREKTKRRGHTENKEQARH